MNCDYILKKKKKHERLGLDTIFLLLGFVYWMKRARDTKEEDERGTTVGHDDHEPSRKRQKVTKTPMTEDEFSYLLEGIGELMGRHGIETGEVMLMEDMDTILYAYQLKLTKMGLVGKTLTLTQAKSLYSAMSEDGWDFHETRRAALRNLLRPYIVPAKTMRGYRRVCGD